MSLFTFNDDQTESVSRSPAIARPVSVEVQSPLHDYRQIPGDIVGSPNPPNPLAGSSLENPIDVDAPRNAASKTRFLYQDSSAGDSAENPIDVDRLCGTEDIESLSPCLTRTEHMSDGRSLEEVWCKICYDSIVNLALGCGHTYCYDCINKTLHDYLESGGCEISCPFCKTVLPEYESGHLNGSYFPLQCPYSDDHCPFNGWMVNGIKLKMP